MITNDQLDKIERHAHPRTSDGKIIRRLIFELRAGAANFARVKREHGALATTVADLTLAVGDLGYRVERDGAAVVLVPISPAACGANTEDGAP